MIDFLGAVERLPTSIPRLHHGRDIRGLDCAGLVIYLYREAGCQIDQLDLEYTEADCQGRDIFRAMLSQLGSFQEVTAAFRRNQYQDGDIVLLRFAGERNHLGVYVADRIYHMTQRLHRSLAQRLRLNVLKAYRLAER